jgi:hypothetical protein
MISFSLDFALTHHTDETSRLSAARSLITAVLMKITE